MKFKNLDIIAVFILWIIMCNNVIAVDEYISGTFTKEAAESYGDTRELSIRYLAQRDLQPWLAKVPGKLALDYGSGLGFSVDFLLKQGFKVDAVDINPEMIAAGEKAYPQAKFILADESKLPFADHSFDLVFSSWVLFELNSLAKMVNYLKESKRVLKENGYFIGIIASKNIYDPNYKSNLYETNFPENHKATSGSLVKMKYREIDMTFSDYYWLESDYRKAFADADLQICAVHYPLGKKSEGYDWQDELRASPVLLILATNHCNES